MWRARREEAEARGEAPSTWFERAVDYVDGRVLSRVKVGRRADPEWTDDRPASPWEDDEGAGGAEAEAAASWEAVTPRGEEGEASLPGSSATDAADGDERPRQTERAERAERAASSARSARRGPDPLADRDREPDFVFTLGGDASEAEEERSEERSGERSGRSDFARAYTREKRSAPIGDAVSSLTQTEPARAKAARDRARAEAAARASASPRRSGASADVHTNITVLTPDSFDASVALASRPADGVGLGVAGGLGNDGGAGAIPGTQKRRWLVAFCARWAPPCNLLVREFALIGSRPDATSFALGWVDCTPAAATAFCGARFDARGYPTILLVAGGRVVRYDASAKERIAGAIAPWAVEAAEEIEAHAPNSGTPPPGDPIPPPTPRREPADGRAKTRAGAKNGAGRRTKEGPSSFYSSEEEATERRLAEGRRGSRAYSESEFDALARERERQRKRYAKEEERRLAEAARRERERLERGETTAPDASSRRARRERARARAAAAGEL